MGYHRKGFLGVVAVALCLFLASPSLAMTISTFDAGLEGWTASGGALSHVAAGGNPGGFLQLFDNVGTWMTIYAPAAFGGDLSSYIGGGLSFDARNVNGAAPDLVGPPLFGTVTISGIGGTASRVLGGTGSPAADGLWHTYSATLDPVLWTGDLRGAVGSVTQISIVLESNEQIVEGNGFDNFAIRDASQPVPEPSPITLVGLGLAGLCLAVQWRRQKGSVIRDV